ncbi:hypothetical protein [Pseudoteredinibacter isoporae]|nr:hypothetical protein [Pseudoteredinibacter isoporae]
MPIEMPTKRQLVATILSTACSVFVQAKSATSSQAPTIADSELHGYTRLSGGPTGEQMKQRLIRGFGGEQAIRKLSSFGARLRVSRPGKPEEHSLSYYDFDNQRLASFDLNQGELSLITNHRSALITNGVSAALPEAQKARLLANMKVNFLYLVRHQALELLGPLDIPSHTSESWWLFRTGDDVSPPLGLNPETGRITKVLFSDRKFIVEMDYQALNTGIWWPAKFQLYDGKHLKLEGHFSEVEVNQEARIKTPNWFKPSIESTTDIQ